MDVKEFTFPCSKQFASMTTVATFFSQIIHQKSSMVVSSGPWQAMNPNSTAVDICQASHAGGKNGCKKKAPFWLCDSNKIINISDGTAF